MKIILVLMFVSLLAGCSSSPQSNGTGNYDKATTHSSTASRMGEDQLLFYLLRKEFSYWKGTPYRLGGNDKKGIDCSALVKKIYHASFNITLPRTTETQVKQGYLVYKDQLQVGDLIFFKTGWQTRHVGIYIGNNEFIHASTSKGVITSSINNVYWKGKYWQSRRILD